MLSGTCTVDHKISTILGGRLVKVLLLASRSVWAKAAKANALPLALFLA